MRTSNNNCSFISFRGILFCLNIKKIARAFILFIVLISRSECSFAQRYWVSTTGGLWSNAANWSTTSGGAGGAGAPVGMPAIFDGAGGAVGNCTINTAVTVTGFSVISLYNGSIYQGANAITINGNSRWSNGFFIGGSSNITNTGSFFITGGDFTSTAAFLNINNTFSISSGSFSHNTGTTRLNTNNFGVNGSPAFYNLTLLSAANVITFNNSVSVANNLALDLSSGNSLQVQIVAGNVILVSGNIYLSGSGPLQVNTGTVEAKGDIYITRTSTAGGGSGTFLITGTGNQLLSNTGIINQGKLPSVVINKPSGTLSLSGMISVIGPNWNYISGTISPGTSTVNFTKQSGGSNIMISGSHTLYDAIISSSYGNTTINNNLTLSRNLTLDGASASNSITINNTITVMATLSVTGNQQVSIVNGLLDVKGDIINGNNAVGTSGSGTVSLTGTGNQLWSCVGSDGQGSFPNILINKPSGVLSLSGVISSYGPKWTYSAGTISPGTSTVCLYDDGSASITISGTHTLNDVILYPLYSTNVISGHLTVNNITFDGSTQHDVTISSTLTVNGTLIENGTDVVRLNAGIINAKGNILNSNTNTNSGGTATLIINGTANQNITGNGVANQSKMPTLIVLNKTSGGVYISGGVPFYFYGTVTFSQGILYSTSAQLAYFYSGSIASGANALSYVDGPVRKRGNTTFAFPVGKNNFYAPISISAPGGVTSVFTGEYFNMNPNSLYNVNSKDASLHHISTCEYWTLDRTSGTSNVSVTLSWDSRSCGVTSMPNLRVARWDGTTWKDHGNGSVSGSNAAGTIVSNGLVTSFSPFTLASINSFNPLPIELRSFEANCKDGAINVQWVTVTEVTNDYFTLEHSEDGVAWSEVVKIKSKGNSTTDQYYTTTSNPPSLQRINYYRLKQTDFSGGSKYFHTAAVLPCKEYGLSNVTLFPNPLTDIIRINTKYPQGEIKIYDASGKVIFKSIISLSKTEIDLSSFANGIYFVNYSFNEITESFKVVKSSSH